MRREWLVLACAGAGLLSAVSALPATAACSAPVVVGTSATVTCAYSGAVQTWVVPNGVTSATFTLYGAKGGDGADAVPGGSGAAVTGTSPVAAGASFDLTVGGAGGDGADPAIDPGFGTPYAPGGWPSGGDGGGQFFGTVSGGGGGATTLASAGTVLLVAAGGGGGGVRLISPFGSDGGNADSDGLGAAVGGAGGGRSGENGGIGGLAGGAASSDICGLAAGQLGYSAIGGNGGGGVFPGGGGGGGIVGGGQGGSLLFEETCGIRGGAGGGGGGSSSPGAVAALAPGQAGDGLVVITYAAPARPTSAADCKNGGWQAYGIFKNQGDCVSYVAVNR